MSEEKEDPQNDDRMKHLCMEQKVAGCEPERCRMLALSEFCIHGMTPTCFETILGNHTNKQQGQGPQLRHAVADRRLHEASC